MSVEKNAPNDADPALAEFTAYVVANYPPGCRLTSPAWHAPKLFRAARDAVARQSPTATAAANAAPVCWRCKERPGVVSDGTTNECVECAGETARRTRAMLGAIDDAVREGLTAWPRVMDRVEFVRECVKLHREAATRPSASPSLGGGSLPAGLTANNILARVERYVRWAVSSFPGVLAGLQIRALPNGEIAVTVLGPDDDFRGGSLDTAMTECLDALEAER